MDEALKTLRQGNQKVIVLKRGTQNPPMTSDGCSSLRKKRSHTAKEVGVEKMRAEELAFILYTSGTMAKPKGTVQPHGSYQVYIYSDGQVGLWHLDPMIFGGQHQISAGSSVTVT